MWMLPYMIDKWDAAIFLQRAWLRSWRRRRVPKVALPRRLLGRVCLDLGVPSRIALPAPPPGIVEEAGLRTSFSFRLHTQPMPVVNVGNMHGQKKQDDSGNAYRRSPPPPSVLPPCSCLAPLRRPRESSAHKVQMAVQLSYLRAAIEDSEHRRAAQAKQKRLNAGPTESRQQRAARAQPQCRSPSRKACRAQKVPRLTRQFYRLGPVDSPVAATLSASKEVKGKYLQLLRELSCRRVGNCARAAVAAGASVMSAFFSPFFTMVSMIRPTACMTVLPSPRAEPAPHGEEWLVTHSPPPGIHFGCHSTTIAALLLCCGAALVAVVWWACSSTPSPPLTLPPPPSPPPMVAEEEDVVSSRRREIAALSSEDYASLEATNQAALSSLPNVSKVNFFCRGQGTNKRTGVVVTLNCTEDCCKHHQKIVACSATIPTRAHAAEKLLAAVIEEHAECIRDRTRWSKGETSTAPTAFSHIGEVQRKASEVAAAKQREKEHHRQVVALEDAMKAAAAAELRAVQERESIESALAELKGSVQSAKRQKAADGTASSSTDVGTGAQQGAEQNDDEPSWRSWTLPRWRKHEKEVQKRRSRPVRAEGVDVDVANEDKSLPPRGDEERGWRRHWRRGLIGSIQDWAAGSRPRVVFMLAEMAHYFGVEAEVRSAPRTFCTSSSAPLMICGALSAGGIQDGLRADKRRGARLEN